MSVTSSPIGGFAGQFFDNNGQPLSGGKIYTYVAGTTTPQATYTSALGVTPHANPIILDSAGRVPGGEIWLIDGLIYKFKIDTATDILIGTYDNITGVNSNFVNYTAQEEVQTATAGQTVFNLSTIDYTPGTNSLTVYIDGVNQYVGDSYLETDSDTVTFTSGLHAGAEVKFTTAIQTTGGATSAGAIAYDPVVSYPSGSLGNFLNPFFGVSDAVFEVTTQAGVGLQRGISVEHYADTGGSYGVDIHQYQGAKNAFVVHCYSDENGAVAGAVAAQIDHTRHGNILVLKNAENPVTSPGTRGTANFLSFIGYGGSPQTTPKELGALTHQLAFISYDPLYPYTFSGGLVAVAGTGHAQALKSTSLLDTLYAGEFYGTDKGVFVSTTNTNSGFNLSVVKNGTGSGTLVGLVNSGFGDFLIGYNGSFGERVKIDINGQYYVQGTRVLTVQQPFIADPVGGATVDTQARTAINSILDLLAAHGLMAPV